MKSLDPKIAREHSVHFAGIIIPKGAVYMRVDAGMHHGKYHSRRYVWVDDTLRARNKNHFTINIIHVNDNKPRRVYMNCTQGWPKVLKEFIDSMDESQLCICKPVILRKDIRAIGPKEPTGGQHYKPSRGYKHYLTGLLNR